MADKKGTLTGVPVSNKTKPDVSNLQDAMSIISGRANNDSANTSSSQDQFKTDTTTTEFHTRISHPPPGSSDERYRSINDRIDGAISAIDHYEASSSHGAEQNLSSTTVDTEGACARGDLLNSEQSEINRPDFFSAISSDGHGPIKAEPNEPNGVLNGLETAVAKSVNPTEAKREQAASDIRHVFTELSYENIRAALEVTDESTYFRDDATHSRLPFIAELQESCEEAHMAWQEADAAYSKAQKAWRADEQNPVLLSERDVAYYHSETRRTRWHALRDRLKWHKIKAKQYHDQWKDAKKQAEEIQRPARDEKAFRKREAAMRATAKRVEAARKRKEKAAQGPSGVTKATKKR